MGDTLPTIDLAGGEPALTLFGDTSTYCALFTGGRAKCWGTGAPSPATECGRNCVLFQRTTPPGFGARLPFLNVAKGRKVVDMLVARGLVCAALDDQSVGCWTPPGFGLTPPTRLASGARLYAAGSVLCRLDDAGALRCWGDATAGVLGTRSLRFNPEWVDGGAKGAFPIKRVPKQPIELGPGRRAVDTALSETHLCATLQDGGLLCWERNQSGELGLGHSGDELCFSPDERDFRCRRVPPSATVDLKSQARIKKVAVAWQNTCVLFEDATLKCWGDNAFGQLGLGDRIERDTPATESVPY